VYSLAYDPDRKALWYAVHTLAGPATLFEADAATGAVSHSYALPPELGDGGLSDQVRVAPDGTIWASQAFEIVNVDPATSDVFTVPLSQTVEGQLSSATSSTNPGTWTTSIAVTSNSVVVGRNNVPFLQQWSFDRKATDSIPLANSESGPTDIEPADGGLNLLFDTHGGVADANFRDHVAMTAGSGAPISKGGTALSPKYLTTRIDGANAQLESPDGNAIVDRSATAGQLSWNTASDGVKALSWPTEKAKVTNPLGKTVEANVTPTLEAALLEPDGTLWVVRGGASIELVNYAP
jgi:hypothetical protein